MMNEAHSQGIRSIVHEFAQTPKGKIILISFAFVIGVAYRLLMGVQGIDITDMGFCMTFYQNIFSHPDAMTFYFNYYLTGFFGGAWNIVMGDYGLMGFRLFEQLTMASALLLTLLSFYRWFTSTWVMLAAVLLSFLFPSIVVTFHYDTLSFFFMSASLYTMMRWLKCNSWWWLTMAGLLIGISFFVRIVNGILGALILLPFIMGWQQSWKQGFKNACIYGSGLLIGSFLVIGIMLIFGHLNCFIKALEEAYSTFNGQETSHTSSNLISVYLNSYVNIGLQVLAFVFIGLFNKFLENKAFLLRVLTRVFLLVVLFILVATSQPYLSAIAACSLLSFVCFKQMESQQRWLILYAAACAYLFPFGSDIGIPGIFHWCAGLFFIPAATCYQLLKESWKRQMVWGISLSIALCMLYKMSNAAYGEEKPRYKTTTMAISGTLNVMTTEERARLYQNEVARIREYAAGDSLLLIANQASELYYATGMLPFTGNTQMGSYIGETLASQLDRQVERHGRFPLVVFIHRSHFTDDMEEFRQSLRPWMKRHHYQTVYADADIELYKPNKTLNKY